MCKRAVETNRQEPGRLRNLHHTQGPLDYDFGQHRAFPEQDSELPAWSYLADVRRQAQDDRICHFVESQNVTNIATKDFENPEESVSLLKEYIDEIIQKLMQAKQESLTSPVKKEIQISVEEIDADELEFSSQHQETQEITKFKESQGEEEIEDFQEEENSEGQETNETDHSISGFSSESSNQRFEVDYQATPDSKLNHKTSPDLPTSAAKWRIMVFGSPPPPLEFFFSALEHPTVIKLIVYYTKWLLATMPPSVDQWIFCTFVRLDNGLDHRELAFVRDLGRKARKLRLKSMAANIPYTHAYDMILAIVGEYYGQRDLLE